jgi:putative membrane protein
MDFATLDLHLAIGHHILIFAIAGVLAFEIGATRAAMDGSDVRRVARVDMWYGILAVAILVVGFARANFAAKGWAYYAGNEFFWAKIGTFAAVGVLSIYPTVVFLRWRAALKKDDAFMPFPGQIAGVRRFLLAEAFLFLLIPVFAAIMARGYSSFTP